MLAVWAAASLSTGTLYWHGLLLMLPLLLLDV